MNKRIDLDVSLLIDMHDSGMSVDAIAQAMGVSRPLIYRHFKAAGFEWRNASQANLLRMSQMSAEQRQDMTQAAHDANRRPQSASRRQRIAQAVERQPSNRSNNELALFQMLQHAGVEGLIPQQAVGPYNIDIGARPVAIEVWTGYWHWHGRHLERTPGRFHYLMSQGWDVLVLHVTNRYRSRITNTTARYVAHYVDYARANPERVLEYRVVQCSGQTIASGDVRQDLDQIWLTIKERQRH